MQPLARTLYSISNLKDSVVSREDKIGFYKVHTNI